MEQFKTKKAVPAVADLVGHEGRVGQNVFIFMRFREKLTKYYIGTPGVGVPLWEILDPSLVCLNSEMAKWSCNVSPHIQYSRSENLLQV